MPGFFGKSGADAIAALVTHVCKIITKYRAKLDQAIDLAAAAGAITTAQATELHDWVTAAAGICVLWQKVAAVSGF